jgi:hypothetical protein
MLLTGRVIPKPSEASPAWLASERAWLYLSQMSYSTPGLWGTVVDSTSVGVT